MFHHWDVTLYGVHVTGIYEHPKDPPFFLLNKVIQFVQVNFVFIYSYSEFLILIGLPRVNTQLACDHTGI